jgi:hypothetical protein
VIAKLIPSDNSVISFIRSASQLTIELRRLRVGKATFIIHQLRQQSEVENPGGSKSP